MPHATSFESHKAFNFQSNRATMIEPMTIGNACCLETSVALHAPLPALRKSSFDAGSPIRRHDQELARLRCGIFTTVGLYLNPVTLLR
jgi:hypothetical protein